MAKEIKVIAGNSGTISRCVARQIAEMVKEFYEYPENRKAFAKWQRRRAAMMAAAAQ